jgi:DNA mismatch repair protein MSH6
MILRPLISYVISTNNIKAKKVVSYAESDGDDDEDAFDPAGISSKRRKRRPKTGDDEDSDVFVGDVDGAVDDDGMLRALPFQL